jgi:hypothetical protein
MSYIIKQTRIETQTLYADVEYTFADGSVALITVANYAPQSKEEVIANIEQREISEQANIDATKQNELIAQQLADLIS